MVHHPKTGRDKQMSQGDSVEEKLVQVVVSWLNTFSTYDYPLPMPQDKKEHFAKLIITDTLKAVADGGLKMLCPECEEPIELLRCNACHLANIEGYILPL